MCLRFSNALLLSRSRKTLREISSSAFVSRRAISSSFTTFDISLTLRSLFSSSSLSSIFSIVFAMSKLSITSKTSFTSSSFRFYFFVTTKSARVACLTRLLSLISWRFVNVFNDINDIFAFLFLNLKSFFLFKFISFEFDFTLICETLILRSIYATQSIHSTREIIRYANCLCNKMNKKIIKSSFFV